MQMRHSTSVIVNIVQDFYGGDFKIGLDRGVLAVCLTGVLLLHLRLLLRGGHADSGDHDRGGHRVHLRAALC